MKKFYAFLFAMLPVLAQGQDVADRARFSFGGFGGAQLLGKIYDDNKMGGASGWTGGLDIGYSATKKKSGVSIHFQPNYSTFKKKEEDGERGSFRFTEFQWKWAAIHLPFVVRYTIGNGQVRPFAELGLNIRIRTALSYHSEGTGCGVAGCNTVIRDVDLQKTVKNDPVGPVAAIGVEIDAGKVVIPLTVRISESFRVAGYTEDRVGGISGGKIKTKYVQVTAGVSF
nr:hypothetical protein [uncultured Dyadobacter sp.]